MGFSLVLLIGVISSVVLRSLIQTQPVQQIAQRELIYVKSSISLNDVFIEFRRTRTPSIQVLEDDQFAGIIGTDNIAEVILIHNTRQV